MILVANVVYSNRHHKPEYWHLRTMVRATDPDQGDAMLRELVDQVKNTPNPDDRRMQMVVRPCDGGEPGWLRAWEVEDIWLTEIPEAAQRPGAEG